MSKHWVLKIIVLQLFKPFPGEMLKNELRTKQSTEKLWACEPEARWVAEHQAGNEAERQAGDSRAGKPGALEATYRSVNRNHLHSLEGLREGLAMIIFRRLYNTDEVGKSGFQLWLCINLICSLCLKSLQRQGKHFLCAYSESPGITNGQRRASAGLNERTTWLLSSLGLSFLSERRKYLQGHQGTHPFHWDSFSILVAHLNPLRSPRPHQNPLRFKILGVVG